MTPIEKVPYWKQHPERWNVQCPDCDVKTASQGGLKTHITRMHTPKYTVWACPRVGCATTIYTVSQYHIIVHNKVMHSKDIESDGETMTPWTAKPSKSKRVAHAISEVARQMVKGIANEYIDVEDTSAGRSAQRFWYEQAEIMLKGYVRKLKLTYKK